MPNFWGTKPFSAITITGSALVPEGRQVLTRAGKTVYIGDIGDPIEDAEFDGVILSPSDYQKLKDDTA